MPPCNLTNAVLSSPNLGNRLASRNCVSTREDASCRANLACGGHCPVDGQAIRRFQGDAPGSCWALLRPRPPNNAGNVTMSCVRVQTRQLVIRVTLSPTVHLSPWCGARSNRESISCHRDHFSRRQSTCHDKNCSNCHASDFLDVFGFVDGPGDNTLSHSCLATSLTHWCTTGRQRTNFT